VKIRPFRPTRRLGQPRPAAIVRLPEKRFERRPQRGTGEPARHRLDAVARRVDDLERGHVAVDELAYVVDDAVERDSTGIELLFLARALAPSEPSERRTAVAGGVAAGGQDSFLDHCRCGSG